MRDQAHEYHSWKGTDNPFVQIPEDPRTMGILIIIVTLLTIGVAVFSLTYGITDLYQYLFLLPIVMTAYFFPRQGIAASVVMGLSLIASQRALYRGEPARPFPRMLYIRRFSGIGGIITMLSGEYIRIETAYQDILPCLKQGPSSLTGTTGHIAEANPGFLAPLEYETTQSGLPAFGDLFSNAKQYRNLADDVKTDGRITDRKCTLLTSSGHAARVPDICA